MDGIRSSSEFDRLFSCQEMSVGGKLFSKSDLRRKMFSAEERVGRKLGTPGNGVSGGKMMALSGQNDRKIFERGVRELENNLRKQVAFPPPNLPTNQRIFPLRFQRLPHFSSNPSPVILAPTEPDSNHATVRSLFKARPHAVGRRN